MWSTEKEFNVDCTEFEKHIQEINFKAYRKITIDYWIDNRMSLEEREELGIRNDIMVIEYGIRGVIFRYEEDE